MSRAFLSSLALTVAAVLGLAATPSAHAGFVVTITEGAQTVTVADNGAGDLNPALGVITTKQNGFAGYSSVSVTASSNSSLTQGGAFPTPNGVLQTTVHVNRAGSGAAPAALTVSASDNTFGLGHNNPFSTTSAASGSYSTRTSATATFTSLFNSTASGPRSFTLSPPTGSLSDNLSGSFTPSGSYSITNITTISGLSRNATAGLTLTSGAVAPFPEPATLTLALGGLGMAGAGWLVRRVRARA